VRRFERQITTESEIRAILSRERVVRVAFAVGDEPYIVPLSYGYDPTLHTIFLHTAAAGRKIEFIDRNPRVCFEIEGSSIVLRGEKACAWGLEYESLIGYGVLSEVLGAEDKRRAVERLMQQHSDEAVHWEFAPGEMTRVRIWRLVIESVTGKRAT
jgi:nitroimidazol reductase NimA-like FMN-containing flavoprotein (pyridoxamine 5'-phosphate oxidase superfamily)